MDKEWGTTKYNINIINPMHKMPYLMDALITTDLLLEKINEKYKP
jgi:hypothetical protein